MNDTFDIEPLELPSLDLGLPSLDFDVEPLVLEPLPVIELELFDIPLLELNV